MADPPSLGRLLRLGVPVLCLCYHASWYLLVSGLHYFLGLPFCLPLFLPRFPCLYVVLVADVVAVIVVVAADVVAVVFVFVVVVVVFVCCCCF